jgi:hypothetical protein
MGAAAYNRGSRKLAIEADRLMPTAVARSDRQALSDENARLREQVANLTRDLARARRCLAAERYGREQLRLRAAEGERSSAFAVSTLCRLAFPGDVAESEAAS